MSFDVFLQTHNYTGEMRAFTNEWTGETSLGPVDAGATPAERQAIVDLFAPLVGSGQDEPGHYVLDFSDGGRAEVFAGKIDGDEPFTGCMFAIRSGFTPQLCGIIWRVANLGRMSMFATMDGARPIVTAEEHLLLLPEDWDDAVVCGSPQELGVLLDKGFSAWDEYRRRILG